MAVLRIATFNLENFDEGPDLAGRILLMRPQIVRLRADIAWAEGVFLSSMKRMAQALEVRRLVDQILDADPDARIVVAGDFNAAPDEIPVLAIRGDIEDTGNPALTGRVLVPIENTVPASSRYTLFHRDRGEMLAFADDRKFPESDHAPVVATFDLP
jgi:predicted extracellular nuclease